MLKFDIILNEVETGLLMENYKNLKIKMKWSKEVYNFIF